MIETRAKPKIESINIKFSLDEWPDLSWLGEYTQHDPGKDARNRGSAFSHDRGNHRTLDFFVPMNSVEDHRKGLSKIGYSKGNAEYLARKYCREDYQRANDYNNDQWCMIGITAEAEVITSPESSYHRIQSFNSSGIWGIESDSGQDYVRELIEEQLIELRAHLVTYNVDVSNFEELTPEYDGDINL